MESNGSSRFRHSQSKSSDRFLGVYPNSPISDNPSLSSSVSEELNEDDVFLSGDFSDKSNGSNSAEGLPSSQHQKTYPSFTPFNRKSFPQPENFGILAAIRDPSRPQSHIYQKPSISSSASSSSLVTSAPSSARSIPKPPQERIPVVSSSSSSLGRFHQSAPVNVPMLAKPMRKKQDFDDYDMELEEEGEMLPGA